ncbi:hypothetical protein AOL_s00188g72 [Orbilia oligospora ATCC 24927]|uniref:Protein kinase domain-containing protein n=2 Tax=Orbilia oligospora TaxID=2813651 RepID=G1XQ61_ARTOA|nr:hypothetical protein AOL_s00188g72 [Orbilia oligospora ATCC 24927]EGX44734.1 hypothetical protein AOL_s00188g72 [Orbilia oligospora ATCC 24927]KAF3275084.1 hypothetical protein TWF970_007524 [Orbilia oligospora]
MEWLKSAAASAVSRGPAFGYSFGDRVDLDDSIWALHNGTKKDDGSKCSIFAFDINANKSRLPLAKNALRKWRTLRHPGVVRVLDTLETDTNIYIATERVVPLGWHVKRNALNTETIKWGLYTISTTMRFVNEDASSIHGNLRVSSIYTTESGEWKLAGFEVLSSLKEEDPAIYTYGGLLPDSTRYAAPEIGRGGWDGLKNQAIHVTDSWNMGTLIYEIFNGYFSTADQLSQIKSIPPPMGTPYKRLTQTNPKMRLPISHFLEQGKRSNGFFDTPLIRCCEFIENMGVKDDREREEFLQNLEDTKDQFPEEFFKAKVLPELLKSVEYGGGGPKVFSVVLMIAEKLNEDEWESTITPCVVRLFSSPDRAIRVFLLDNLPRMIEHLPKKVVSDSIFPQLVTGFSDVAPIVREQTVKSILIIIDKLSDRQINGDLLKYLAKTQNDEQPGIRTNTTICLGKIAKNLGQHTRAKVLAAAFTRSLRDPFVHARNAALMALAATADCFDETDCATKCLPAICVGLIDKEKIIRVQAQKTMDVFLARIKTLTANMPDSALPPVDANGVPTGTSAAAGGGGVAGGAPRMGTPQNDASWAGWAISSFTKKLGSVTGEIQAQGTTATSGVSTPAGEESGTLGVPSSTTGNTGSRPGSSSLQRQAFGGMNTNTSRGGGGGGGLMADDGGDDDLDAWGDMDDTPKTVEEKKNTTISGFGRTTMTTTEDDVISSFAANKGKSSLPKGLGKKTTTSTTTTTPASNSTGTGAVKSRPIVSRAVKPAAKKVLPAAATTTAAKKKTEEEGDAWGNDNWDVDWK